MYSNHDEQSHDHSHDHRTRHLWEGLADRVACLAKAVSHRLTMVGCQLLSFGTLQASSVCPVLRAWQLGNVMFRKLQNKIFFLSTCKNGFNSEDPIFKWTACISVVITAYVVPCKPSHEQSTPLTVFLTQACVGENTSTNFRIVRTDN